MFFNDDRSYRYAGTPTRFAAIMQRVNEKKLFAIDLSSAVDLTDEQFSELCKVLVKDDCLVSSLKLSNCNINDGRARMLARILNYNCSLRELDLSRTQITHQGALCIVAALVNKEEFFKNKKGYGVIHPEVETLHIPELLAISWDDEDWDNEKSSYYQGNTILESLNLSSNDLGGGDAHQAICCLLLGNDTLKELHLNSVGFTPEEAALIHTVFACNHGLRRLMTVQHPAAEYDTESVQQNQFEHESVLYRRP